MWANNEVGTLQPVREIAAFAAQQGAICTQRRGSGRRSRRGRLCSMWVGSADLHRAQARRTVRDWCLAGAPRASAGSVHARRRSGAGRSLGHPGCTRPSPALRPQSRSPRGIGSQEERRVRELRRQLDRLGARAPCQRQVLHGPDRRGKTAFQASPTSGSRDVLPTRS